MNGDETTRTGAHLDIDVRALYELLGEGPSNELTVLRDGVRL
jgi:hypothetical protein